MDTANEILDAIEILFDKKISENITKVLTGICTSVNINKNTCVIDSNGVSSTVQFYGSPPEVNELYRIFVPSNDMSRSFIVVPPKFTVNPNLLDNWYFGNPVNQRGQTEYIPNWNGYCIDRWSVEADSDLVITLVDNGVHVQNRASKTRQFKQILPSELKLAGKMVTISILCGDVVGSVNYVLSQVSSPYQNTAACWAIKAGLFSATGSVLMGQQKIIIILDPGAEITILAAKLELGPTQTLAHQENGVWVLNEVPDYGEQLMRCWRYYINSATFGVGESAGQRSQIWPIKSTSMHYCAGAQFPVIMRTTPAVTIYSAVNGTKNAISNALNGADSPAIASAAFVGSDGFHQITLQGEDSTLDQSVACYTYIASADL